MNGKEPVLGYNIATRCFRLGIQPKVRLMNGNSGLARAVVANAEHKGFSIKRSLVVEIQ